MSVEGDKNFALVQTKEGLLKKLEDAQKPISVGDLVQIPQDAALITYS